MNIEQRNADGSYHRWNFDKYVQLRLFKGDILKGTFAGNPEVYHPFLGKKFLRETDVVVFTKTVKHWLGGYYYLGVYEVNDSGSHGAVVIENINSIDETIIKQAKEFKANYKLTDELVKS